MSAISRREARRAAVFMLFQWDVTGRPLGSLYEGEVEDMANAILRGTQPRVSLADSRGNTATLLALYESARTGQPISLR
mgnify:CR=1 FL=1